MTERFGPALQEANIRALTPHDTFADSVNDLAPGELGKRLSFKGAKRHLPDADEPTDMTGEGYDAQNCRIPDCDAASSDDDSEIDEIMRRDLDPDWPDRPLDDLDFDPYPDPDGQPLDPAFDAAPVAYVGGIRGRGTMADKYGSFAETQCIPFCTDRRFTDSHGDRGRKRHRPMHVSIRHMMPIDES